MTRAGIAALFSLLASVATSQSSAWSYSSLEPGLDGEVTDALVLDSSIVLTMHFRDPSLTYSAAVLAQLDPEGNPLARTALWTYEPFASCKRLVPRTSGVFDCIGQARSALGSFSFERIGLSQNLVRLDSASIHVPDVQFIHVNEAIRLENGGIFTSGTSIRTGESVPDQLILGYFDPNGDSLSYSGYHNDYYAFVPRSAVELGPDTLLLTTMGGFMELGPPSGSASATRIVTGVGPIDRFWMPAWDGSGAEPIAVNTFGDLHDALLISDRTVLIGGSTLFGGPPGTRSAVVKLRLSDGAWLGAFQPNSGYSADLAGILGSMEQDGDGHVLFAMTANRQIYNQQFQSLVPSQVRVFKLDTALNVICSTVLNGFTDSAYYELQRIRATPDGGYILMGRRADLTQPTVEFAAWAQKFNAEDCLTSMNEVPGAEVVQVFPLPGTDEMRITLNGPERGAMVRLFDANGRLSASVPILQGSARVDTRALTRGMYLYRVVDRQGMPLATGRWVKE